MNIFSLRRPICRALIILLSTILVACGGTSGDEGELIGTGFYGTSAQGAPIAQSEVTVKSDSGEKISAQTNTAGEFTTSKIAGSGPFLLRVTPSSGSPLYSIVHKQIEGEEDISVNIHPFTDFIVRNWFELQGLDIDSEFESDSATANLPTQSQIEAIKQEVTSLLSTLMTSYDVASDFDLISTPFNANHTGFDLLLDNSSIVINNSNIVNIVINESTTNIQNTLINNIYIGTDLTSSENNAPTIPSNVRALTASNSAIAVIWDSSTDDLGVAGYNIYRNGVFIASTPFSSFTDTDLSASTSYSYEVEAFDSKGLLSGKSSATTDIETGLIDSTAPPTATSLAITENNEALSLAWNQSSIDEVAGFKVLRGSAGNVSQQLAIITSNTFTDFSVVANTEYCYVIITIDAAGNESSPTSEACLTIESSDALPSSLSFSQANYEIAESSAVASLTIYRSGNASEAISVDYTISGVTATSGSDYVATSGTLNWSAADNASKTIDIQIIQDALEESNETVEITLSNPSTNTTLGSITSATLTITNVTQAECVDLEETDITADTTLSLPCYNVKDDITITNASILSINPGVTLKFAAGKHLEAESDGVLYAVGTAQQPITFTGALKAPGYWDGIEIRSIVPSELEHTIVEYGGNSSSFNEANIGLSFNGKASIKHSVIRYSNAAGVKLDDGETLTAFSNNVVTLNLEEPVYTNADGVEILGNNNSFTGNADAAGNSMDFIHIEGDLSKSQVWHDVGVYYYMPTNRTSIRAMMTVQPGVEMVFPANAMLDIEATGTLKAQGTEQSPILFTGEQKSPGYWNGIQFTFNNNDNVIDHAIVEYGGSGGNTEANVGVFGSNGRLSISNTLLQHSENNGFYFHDGISLTMDNVTSTGNAKPGLIYFDDIGKLDTNSNYTGNALDRVKVNGSTLQTNQTVKNIGVPYFIANTTQATVTAALDFEPGVEMQFNSGGGLRIERTGSLAAQGTAEEPIIFTGEQKSKGYWKGFQYTFNDSEANIIDHAIIEYAGAAGGNTEGLVGFFGSDTHGQITNTILRHSDTNGIWIDDTTTGDFSTGNSFEDIDGENLYIDN